GGRDHGRERRHGRPAADGARDGRVRRARHEPRGAQDGDFCPRRVEPHRRRSESARRIVTGAVVQVSDLTKGYRGLRPLRIHDLVVVAGESVAIVGLDAASAEVFVNLVTGATLPDAGTIRVFDRPTSAIADGDEWLTSLDRVGIDTERAVLLDQLTVIQNLAMPFTLEIEPPPEEVRERAELMAVEVGLPPPAWTRSA